MELEGGAGVPCRDLDLGDVVLSIHVWLYYDHYLIFPACITVVNRYRSSNYGYHACDTESRRIFGLWIGNLTQAVITKPG